MTKSLPHRRCTGSLVEISEQQKTSTTVAPIPPSQSFSDPGVSQPIWKTKSVKEIKTKELITIFNSHARKRRHNPYFSNRRILFKVVGI